MNKNLALTTTPDRSWDGYTLSWFVSDDPWFHLDEKGRQGTCVWVETVTQPWPTQHMITRRCPCGAIQKFVSQA